MKKLYVTLLFTIATVYCVPIVPVIPNLDKVPNMSAKTHPMLASLFNIANNVQQIDTSRASVTSDVVVKPSGASSPQIDVKTQVKKQQDLFLESGHSIGKEVGPIGGGPTDTATGIIIQEAAILCRYCQERQDVECMKRYCFNTDPIAIEPIAPVQSSFDVSKTLLPETGVNKVNSLMGKAQPQIPNMFEHQRNINGNGFVDIGTKVTVDHNVIPGTSHVNAETPNMIGTGKDLAKSDPGVFIGRPVVDPTFAVATGEMIPAVKQGVELGTGQITSNKDSMPVIHHTTADIQNAVPVKESINIDLKPPVSNEMSKPSGVDLVTDNKETINSFDTSLPEPNDILQTNGVVLVNNNMDPRNTFDSQNTMVVKDNIRNNVFPTVPNVISNPSGAVLVVNDMENHNTVIDSPTANDVFADNQNAQPNNVGNVNHNVLSVGSLDNVITGSGVGPSIKTDIPVEVLQNDRISPVNIPQAEDVVKNIVKDQQLSNLPGRVFEELPNQVHAPAVENTINPDNNLDILANLPIDTSLPIAKENIESTVQVSATDTKPPNQNVNAENNAAVKPDHPESLPSTEISNIPAQELNPTPDNTINEDTPVIENTLDSTIPNFLFAGLSNPRDMPNVLNTLNEPRAANAGQTLRSSNHPVFLFRNPELFSDFSRGNTDNLLIAPFTARPAPTTLPPPTIQTLSPQRRQELQEFSRAFLGNLG